MTGPVASPRCTRGARAAAIRAHLAPSLILALALFGCTQKLATPPPQPPTLGVPDSVQEVLTQNCALAGCHVGAAAPKGEDLGDAVTSYARTVGVPSQEQPAYLRIAAGDSANSYLVMKLRNDPRKTGQPMPIGAYPLDPALVLRIAAWAQQGAPGVPAPLAARP